MQVPYAKKKNVGQLKIKLSDERVSPCIYLQTAYTQLGWPVVFCIKAIFA